ncbi:MAG: 23S rRNA (guanosine(2251)-2'-O)-methyltransferase RlmB [Nitrospinae bacterium]|nr:23S rRNA (guanosine(2251)-2'-O)-methyltransferase RlmB [Nitrospinota bacterium]
MKRKPEYVCGAHSVRVALERGPERVRRLYVTAGRRNRSVSEAVRLAESLGVPVEALDTRQLTQKAATAQHQNLVAEVHPTPLLTLDDLIEAQPASAPPILLLDGLQDPRNFGAILRSAAALGAGGVVWPKDNAVGLTPVAAKAAAGALEVVPLARVTNLARAVSALKEAGYWALAADAHGDKTLGVDELPRPCCLVVGAEGRGVRPLVLKNCDARVRIPIEAGAVSSLNASVAAAILLHGVRVNPSEDEDTAQA